MRAGILLLCGIAICLLPSQVRAQAVSGAITGAVLDPSGSGVPGAHITVTNTATGVAVATVANALGYYNVPNLIAGTYRVSVSAPGFKTSESQVNVSIGSVARVDMHLEVGVVSETVSVTAQAPLLKDEKVNLGGTVTAQQLQNLPTLGRNPTALAKLMPGVTEYPGQSGLPGSGGTGYFSVTANGQRAQLNYQLLDGVDDTEGIGGGASIVPPVDAMQEYTVSTTNYDVEFGQVAGAMSIMTTKSGTNAWHGSAYEYNRVNALFARNPFTEPNGPGHFVFNQFGGTIGGPIQKNKFFVFGNFQGARVRSGGGTLLTMPTAAFRGGDFSALTSHPVFDPQTGGPAGVGRTQFPNNVIPANRLDPAIQKLLAQLPLPNQPGTDNNFIAPSASPINQWLGTVRADYTINDANRMFARYTRTNQDQISSIVGLAPGLWPSGSTAAGTNNSLVFDYTRVVKPTFVLEGRFGWLAREWFQNELDQTQNASQALGIPNLNDACATCGGLVGFRIGGPVGAFDVGNSDHAHQVDNYGGYNFVGIATWTKGSHTVKFGADINTTWRDRRDSSSQGNFGCFNGGLCDSNGFSQNLTGSPAVPGSGLSVASFLLGLSSSFQRIIYARNLPLADQQRTALYLQDTWRATRKLTLNLGLRWDYIGYPTSPQPGGIANFDFSDANTIISSFDGTSATADVKNNYGDFGPRLGAAYRLTQKTVARAGFARTFSLGFFGANFGAITNDWPNATRQRLVQEDPYDPALLVAQGPPQFVSGFDILVKAGNPGRYATPLDSTGFGTDSHNPEHSIDEWNVSIQHEFRQDLAATVSYVGNADRHLFFRRDYNAAVPGPGPFSSRKLFGSIGYLVPAYNQSNQGSSGYQSLQVQVEKRYSQGLLLTTAVTWGRAYDFGSHNAFYPFNTNIDRAPTDDDRALVISVGHVWDLPFGPGKKFLNSPGPGRLLLGGWQFSGISRYMSGTPFTPILSNAASLNSDCCMLRPDRIGTGSVSNPSRSLWFDPAAFTVPPQYTFGNSGRNILRGPNFASFDWSLDKNFQISESKRVEFRWEVFNALNRTNLSNPVNAVDSALAGKIFGLTNPMRRQQLGIDLYW